jgi:hypothetical protein
LAAVAVAAPNPVLLVQQAALEVVAVFPLALEHPGRASQVGLLAALMVGVVVAWEASEPMQTPPLDSTATAVRDFARRSLGSEFFMLAVAVADLKTTQDITGGLVLPVVVMLVTQTTRGLVWASPASLEPAVAAAQLQKLLAAVTPAAPAARVFALSVTQSRCLHQHQRLETRRSATQVAIRFTLGQRPGQSLFKEQTWHISQKLKTVSSRK